MRMSLNYFFSIILMTTRGKAISLADQVRLLAFP